MSARDEQNSKHRHSPSLPQPPSIASPQPPQTIFPHVPRFALIQDLATGSRTYAPITYLFSDEPHPHLSLNDGKSRTLIVDLSAEGDKVEQAQSLSSEWQLVSAKIGTSAKITNVEGGESAPGNSVLNVEGLGQFNPFVRSDDVYDLAKQFSERFDHIFQRSRQKRNDSPPHREVKGDHGKLTAAIAELETSFSELYYCPSSIIHLSLTNPV